jgi:hypothetical protein
VSEGVEPGAAQTKPFGQASVPLGDRVWKQGSREVGLAGEDEGVSREGDVEGFALLPALFVIRAEQIDSVGVA